MNDNIKCRIEDESRLRGYKFKIYPTDDQKIIIHRFIDIARYIYNWGLATQQYEYKVNNIHMSFMDLCKEFRKFRKLPENEWLLEFPLASASCILKSVSRNIKLYIDRATNHPKFKTKEDSRKTFPLRGCKVRIVSGYLYCEGFSTRRNGGIDIKNAPIPYCRENEQSSYYSATISFDGDDYWASVCLERPIMKSKKVQIEPFGIDVGIKNLITVSDGTMYHLPDTSKLEKKLKRKQRRIQKDYDKLLAEGRRTKTKYHDLPKSKNMLKREAEIRKIYKRISNIRNTYIHTATREIINKNPAAIVIEDIKVNELIRDCDIYGSGKFHLMFYTIHHHLKYKAADAGIQVIMAPKHYPSSKRCSNCGAIKLSLPTDKRIYTCNNCGYSEDRDLNASYNLRDLAYNN